MLKLARMENESRERKRREFGREKGGVRFRLVKSREAVILLSWREKVLTWSQRTSASPRFPPLQSLR